jgi:hypothetical protein
MGRRKKRLEKRQHIEKPGREEGSYSFKRFSMKRKILLQGSNITMSVLILVIDHLLGRVLHPDKFSYDLICNVKTSYFCELN